MFVLYKTKQRKLALLYQNVVYQRTCLTSFVFWVVFPPPHEHKTPMAKFNHTKQIFIAVLFVFAYRSMRVPNSSLMILWRFSVHSQLHWSFISRHRTFRAMSASTVSSVGQTTLVCNVHNTSGNVSLIIDENNDYIKIFSIIAVSGLCDFGSIDVTALFMTFHLTNYKSAKRMPYVF